MVDLAKRFERKKSKLLRRRRGREFTPDGGESFVILRGVLRRRSLRRVRGLLHLAESGRWRRDLGQRDLRLVVAPRTQPEDQDGHGDDDKTQEGPRDGHTMNPWFRSAETTTVV